MWQTMEPAMVDFGILGSLRITVDRAEVDVGIGGRHGLLARLLVDANRVVPLDRLVDDLLPHDTRAGRATMRTYVSRLRRALGRHRVLTRAPGYVLVVEPSELDAERFESLVDQAHDAALAPPEAVALLDAAERLWRGPALAEFSDLPWARSPAERLNRLRLDATADRFDALLACGRPQKVAGEAEALVERHALDERLWGLLVVAHYQSGRQAEALRTYQRARTVLVEELGTEPGPVLREIEQAVLRQDAALARVGGGGGVGAERDSGVGPPAARPATDPPRRIASKLSWIPPAVGALVGRGSALQTLHGRVATAARGQGGLVVLSGEAGAGKTRVLASLARQADEQGCLVLYGRCEEDARVPYQSFVTALSPVLRQAVAQGLVDLGPLTADLAVLFPDVGRGAPSLVAGLDPETRRHRLFEAMDRCLEQLARWQTVVLLIDDLHLADRAVLRLLHRLVRGSPERRLVVVALRREELSAGSPVTTTLLDLRRHLPVTEVAVPSLGEDEVAELLASGRRPDQGPDRSALARLARRVHRETSGNALFVTEVIRDLPRWSDGGAGAGALPLPATVADLVEARVLRMQPSTRQLLHAACVVGTDFDLAVAAAVAGLDDPAAIDAVDEAISGGIVVDTGATRGRLAFSHSIVRRAFYQGLATPRRARLHVAAAHALLSRAGDPPHDTDPGDPGATDDELLEPLAHHLVVAAENGAGNIEEAVGYALLAGDRAVSRLSYETGIEHYRRALALLDQGPTGRDGGQRCELLLRLGEALSHGGDTEEAKEHLLGAAALASSRGEPSRVAVAALAFGGALPAGIGLPDERGIRLLHRAVTAQPAGAPGHRALLLARLAEAAYLTAPRPQRSAWCAEALSIARDLGDRRLLATVLVNRYWALRGPDDVEMSLRSAAAVEQIAAETRDVDLSLRAGKCRIHTLLTLDAWPEVVDLAGALRQRARDVRQPEYERLARSLDAVFAGNLGRFADAEQLAGEACDLLVRRRGQRAHAEMVHMLQLLPWRWLQSRLGDLADPVERLTCGGRHDHWQAMVDPALPGWRALRAWLLAENGELAQAAHELELLALPRYLRGERRMDWWLVVVAATVAVVHVGHRDLARVLYEHLLPYRGRNAFVGQVAFLGCVEHHLGLLARTLGRDDDVHLGRALERYRAMGASAYVAHLEQVEAGGGP
jgi:DNA-binding SARP family transcriptional activator